MNGKTYNIAELIGKVRDQRALSKDEVFAIVRKITDETMSDAQLGAFAMAVLCRGLDDQAAIHLTEAMRDSGRILSWDVDGEIVDKHSTGGVGDCVSLALAPILAAAGKYVPMISGRGLGHTGGTLDKLEAIKGFSTNQSIAQMQDQLKKIGCVMAGQSADLAPADKRFYATRDVTGTVPSPELITASILSKKLAAGLQSLVLDVKFGNGAFMKTRDDANALARRLVDTANALGVRTRALITSMTIPLASSAGNALEVIEILDLLEGKTNTPLFDVTQALCVELGMNSDDVITLVNSGAAMEKFEQMCRAQGGPSNARDIRASLPMSNYTLDLTADFSGQFFGLDAYEVGMAVVMLGGGRRLASDRLDLSVGVSNILAPCLVQKGDRIATIHAKDEESALEAKQRILGALHSQAPSEKLIAGVVE